MKVKQYWITIYEGGIAACHGLGECVIEYCIPTHNITFNIMQGNLNVFKGNRTEESKEFKAGTELKEIELNDSIVERLVELCNQQSKTDIIKTILLDNLKEILG